MGDLTIQKLKRSDNPIDKIKLARELCRTKGHRWSTWSVKYFFIQRVHRVCERECGEVEFKTVKHTPLGAPYMRANSFPYTIMPDHYMLGDRID